MIYGKVRPDQEIRDSSGKCGRTVVCPGLQLGQLPPPLGSAPIYQPLVIANPTGQVDQDRSESRQACPLYLLPSGGSVDHTESVCGHPATDSTTDTAGTGLTTQACE